jgi:predicted signal transduction protein with EAL and GGDEF domain
VETAAQLKLLKAWGSRIVQGYYFAKPLPVRGVEALLRSGKIIPEHGDPAEITANNPASLALR